MHEERGFTMRHTTTTDGTQGRKGEGKREAKVMDRRTFLAGALGSGALAALGLTSMTGCAPREASAAEARPGGSFDVVVIGAGGAGMTAALSANDAGANVIVLEKMAVAGGNTCFAEGGMNACGTKVQAEAGIEDSVELFAADTYKGGHDLGNKELIEYLCAHSNEAVERLAERGMFLTKLSTSGGASVPRERHFLTERECDVVRYLAQGRSKTAIGEKLFISENTVRTYVKNIYGKLDVHNKQQLLDFLDALDAE